MDALGRKIYGKNFISAVIKFPNPNDPLAEAPPEARARLAEGFDYWVVFLSR